MERLSERLTALEAIIRKLEPVESFLERVELLEKNIYATKKVFTFSEACMYIGVSESMLYKLTANKEIPHYKPRGKMIYFAKEERTNGSCRIMNLPSMMPRGWHTRRQQYNPS